MGRKELGNWGYNPTSPTYRFKKFKTPFITIAAGSPCLAARRNLSGAQHRVISLFSKVWNGKDGGVGIGRQDPRVTSNWICFVGDFLRILSWHSSPFFATIWENILREHLKPGDST